MLIPNDTARAISVLQPGSASLLALGSPKLYVWSTEKKNIICNILCFQGMAMTGAYKVTAVNT